MKPDLPTVKRSALFDELSDKNVRCRVCERRCQIRLGSTGFCKTRINIDGQLYTLVYGDISSLSANPIEKKPFYHFWPGSTALTAGTYSCNFTCPWCLDPSAKIYLGRNRAITISELEKCWRHHEVITYDEGGNDLRASKIVKYFKIKPQLIGLKAYKIRTKETGREIIATEEHPFFTANGPALIRDIGIGGRVIVLPIHGDAVDHSATSDVIISEDDMRGIIEKFIPRSDKEGIIDALVKRSLLPLSLDNEKILILSSLVGHLFGDGYLTLSRRGVRDRVSTVFTGRPRDLQAIKEDLRKLGFHPNKIIRRRKTSKIIRYGKVHVIAGETTWMASSSKPLWALLKALGVPVGDKATTSYHVPDWLWKASKSVKREFLAAFFGSELTKPRVELSGKNFFQPRFSLNKLEELLENGIEFAHQIGRLAGEFSVKITKINNHPGSLRKDGRRTTCLYVLFSNKLENLLNLYGKIGYRYNKARMVLANYAFEYLLMKEKSVDSWRALHRRALELKEKGLPAREIVHKLAPSGHCAAVRRWLTHPIRTARARYPHEFPKFHEWLKNAKEKLGESGLVWETIESIDPVEISDARDFTTSEPTHNFFANGFLVSNCQNWGISKLPPNPALANHMTPDEFIAHALRQHCQGTSISFNEPTLMFEYSLDVFKLARRQGLYSTFVTNGYMTLEALRMLSDAGLDAINIDVKGDGEAVRKYCGADVELVWRNVRESKRLGLHVEVVNLVIPGVNDREEQLRELARRHLREAGEETPLHFTAYYPAYRFDAPSTPVSKLERAHDIAVSEGLDYVYIGNVPGHRYENTYCPGCGELLIERYGLELVRADLRDRRCQSCGREIPIVGEFKSGQIGEPLYRV